jgi:hypothetical protein
MQFPGRVGNHDGNERHFAERDGATLEAAPSEYSSVFNNLEFRDLARWFDSFHIRFFVNGAPWWHREPPAFADPRSKPTALPARC